MCCDIMLSISDVNELFDAEPRILLFDTEPRILVVDTELRISFSEKNRARTVSRL